MAKFKLLLLDTVIIIALFELGLWDYVLDQCEVHVSEAILGEANFYLDDEGESQPIDLQKYRARLTVHSVPAPRLERLRSGLAGSLLDKMDAGEAELLCVLDDSLEPALICSADAVVYRYLGATRRSSMGISLEEVLTRIGRAQAMHWRYTKRFREQYARIGFTEDLTGETRP